MENLAVRQEKMSVFLTGKKYLVRWVTDYYLTIVVV